MNGHLFYFTIFTTKTAFWTVGNCFLPPVTMVISFCNSLVPSKQDLIFNLKVTKLEIKPGSQITTTTVNNHHRNNQTGQNVKITTNM